MFSFLNSVLIDVLRTIADSIIDTTKPVNPESKNYSQGFIGFIKPKEIKDRDDRNL